MYPVKPPGAHPRADPLATQPQRANLPRRDYAVLTFGQREQAALPLDGVESSPDLCCYVQRNSALGGHRARVARRACRMARGGGV